MRGLQQNAREDQGAYPERQGRFLHVGGDERRHGLERQETDPEEGTHSSQPTETSVQRADSRGRFHSEQL